MSSGIFGKVIDQFQHTQSQGPSNNPSSASGLLNKLSNAVSGTQQRQQFQEQPVKMNSSSHDEQAIHGGNTQQSGYGEWTRGYGNPMSNTYHGQEDGPRRVQGGYGGMSAHGQYGDGGEHGGYDRPAWQTQGAQNVFRGGQSEDNSHNRAQYPQAAHNYPEQGHQDQHQQAHEMYPQRHPAARYQQTHDCYVEQGQQDYPQQNHGMYANEAHGHNEQQGYGPYH